MEIFLKVVLWVILFFIAIRISKNEKTLPNVNHIAILMGMAVLYGLLYFFWNSLQHASFNTFAKDLLVYTQALSSWSLYSPMIGRSLMEEHFSPILYLLVPFCKMFDSAQFLFFLQSVVIVGAVFPLYRLSKRLGANSWTALMMAFIYLNFYFVRNMAFNDFHVEQFMPLMFLLVMDALLSNNKVLFWIMIALSLGIKEDVGFYFAAWFTVLGFAKPEYRKMSFITAGIGFGVGIVSIATLLPSNKGVYPYFSNWEEYGKGLFGVLGGAIIQPFSTIAVFAKGSFWKLMLPLAFLPFISIWGWAMLPVLWLQLSSSNVLQSNLDLYYAAPVLPLLFIAFIAGWLKCQERWSQKPYGPKLLIALGLFVILFNIHWIAPTLPTEEHKEIHQLLKKMPQKGMIFAQANIAPQIKKSNRVRVLGLNSFKEKPDVIIFHVKGNIWPFTREHYLNALNKIRFNTNYKLWKDEFGVQIYVRTGKKKSK